MAHKNKTKTTYIQLETGKVRHAIVERLLLIMIDKASFNEISLEFHAY